MDRSATGGGRYRDRTCDPYHVNAGDTRFYPFQPVPKSAPCLHFQYSRAPSCTPQFSVLFPYADEKGPRPWT